MCIVLCIFVIALFEIVLISHSVLRSELVKAQIKLRCSAKTFLCYYVYCAFFRNLSKAGHLVFVNIMSTCIHIVLLGFSLLIQYLA